MRGGRRGRSAYSSWAHVCFAQTSQAEIEIHTRACIPNYQNAKGAEWGEDGTDHADQGPTLRELIYAKETISSVYNPREPRESVGGRVWEITQPIPLAFNRSHTHRHIDCPGLKKKKTHTHTKKKTNKKPPEIYLQNNKGNTKNGTHFRGFPSRETIPNGEVGVGWGGE